MPQTRAPYSFSVDISEVRREDARKWLRASVEKLSCSRAQFGNFWASFPKNAYEIPNRMLVIADLATIAKKYQLHDHHSWIASVRQAQPYFVALVSTKRDEHYADLVDDLVRHSDLRISVCRHMKRSEVHKCLLEAVSALNPNAIIEVRYLVGRNQLWVAYGDGISGFVDWGRLGMEDMLGEILPKSATVGSRGATLELLTREGELFEIDAESIKALLDVKHATFISQKARESDEAVGQRVRSARLAAGLSQTELGKRIGVDQAIISKLERGKHQPRIDTLRRIAEGLGLTLSEMLVQDVPPVYSNSPVT